VCVCVCVSEVLIACLKIVCVWVTGGGGSMCMLGCVDSMYMGVWGCVDVDVWM